MSASVWVICIGMIVFNIVGVIWLGIIFEHVFLVPAAYIVVLIIVGNINEDACLILALIVAAISLIAAIVKIVCWVRKTKLENRLLEAIKMHDKETVEMLLYKGVYVNHIYHKEHTYPLQMAIEGHDKDMVSLLIKKGVNVNLDYDKTRPLDFAKDEEIIALLKSHGAKTQKEFDEEKKEKDMLDSDFVSAVRSHDLEKVKYFISQGANIDIIGHGLIVEFAFAPMDGSREAGIVNVETTPLMYAVWNDDIEMVKLLVENGANLNSRDSYGKSALMYAAINEINKHNGEIIDYLINKGADIDAKCYDDVEQTALMFATSNGNIENVRALIRNGVDVNARVSKGFTALDIAKYCGHTEIENLLIQSGAYR